ncbi:DUF3157 family protein [Shewanella sp. CAL98-MNA-CIBAN-0140]|uniref:DUF3157 family protein n=1 Tax=Shewanella sp. CAL98-MNA-CIBAN-0140 TaxID=3140462 RepID=UPI003324660F
MKTKLNVIASTLLLVLAPVAMAADVAVITLDNGANVRLKDDFTWEYIITETVSHAAITAKMAVTQAPVSVTQDSASVTLPAGATVSVAANVPLATTNNPAVSTVTSTLATTRLTAAALAQPELLGSTAKDGIKITLVDTKWKDDNVGLVFDFDSTSNEHVTLVEVEASFYNDQGELIKQENLQAWEAIPRMPDTYLRKGQHRQSDTLWIENINQQQWQKQLISLKIVEIESR